MKILDLFPSCFKYIGIISFILCVLMFFGVFGVRIISLKTDSLGVSLSLISFLFVVLSKDDNPDKSLKQKVLVYAVVLNTLAFSIIMSVSAMSSSIFSDLIPLYINAISLFLFYVIMYCVLLFFQKRN